MTKEELLTIISTAKTSSSSAWAAAVVTEETTGPLHALNNDKVTCTVLYSVADHYVDMQTPIIANARVQLEGAKFLEIQRGFAMYAQEAINALNVYEAAPHYGGGRGSSWALAVNISTP